MNQESNHFTKNGFAVLESIVGDSQLTSLETHLCSMNAKGAGSRNLLEHEWCRELARSLKSHPDLSVLLPQDAVAVQCTFFEKSREQNWLVPVHQDLSIPVNKRLDHPELTGWSEKQGNLFVQPPDSVPEQLVAVRLHLDECAEHDGALKVVPGTHCFGKINNQLAIHMRDSIGENLCAVKKGGVLIMKPLLLHASSKTAGSSRRRVLHFVFASDSLPYGLSWRHTA